MAAVPPTTSAYVCPQEGLNALLNISPKFFDNAAHTLGNIYVGLFTTAWATVQAMTSSAVTLNTGTTLKVDELASSGYARSAALTASSWGANTTSTVTIGANTVSVQQSTYGGTITFTNSSGGAWTAVNGIFLATGASGGTAGNASGAGTTVLWYAQFTDGNAVTVANGDSITVTPIWVSAPYPA